MVGVLVRLRLTLLRHQAQGGVEKVLLLVASVVVAAGVGTVAVGGLVALRFAPTDLAGAAVVAFGALVVLTWAVLPLMTGTDDVMNDPARFALLPLPPRRLAVGLLVASCAAPLPLVTLLTSLGTVVTFARGPQPGLSAAVTAVAAVAGAATCLLGSRAVLTWAASLLSGRRGRELTIAAGVVLLALLGLTGPVLAALGERLQSGSLDAAVVVLAWSPLGAAWGVGWAASEGRWLVVAARAGVAAVTLALLWWTYQRAVRARLRPVGGGGRGPRTPTRRRPRRALLPDTVTATLLLRSLRYWRRDSRYSVSVITLPVVVLLLLVLPSLTGVYDGLALVTGPLLGLLLGVTMFNELAFDGSALWTSLAAGVRGRADRTARVLALLVWGAPFVVVTAVLGAVVGGRPELAPAAAGLGVGGLLLANGVAAVLSVALPFPVPPSGSNPFAGSSGGGTAALVQQAVGALVMTPLLAPLLALAAWAWFVPPVGWLLALLGPAWGSAVLAVGVRQGGTLFDRRGPELLARLSR